MIQRRRPVAAAIRDLHPAYFALVMSTGIVSIAFRGLGIDVVAFPLAVLNVVSYAVLVVLYGARIAFFSSAFVADLRDRDRRWGFLTFIVGTNTVGSQFVLFFGQDIAAAVLWLFTAVTCPLLLYYIYVTAFVGEQRVADIGERIDGTFLLTTVSMQSLAVLGVLLSDHFPAYDRTLVLTSLAYWAAGFVLYLLVLTLVVYRLFSTTLEPRDWTGPYWICMGAGAITTLAGAALAPRLRTVGGWEPFVPATLTVTFLAWAVGTWWIPVLLAVDWWKFVHLDRSTDESRWVVVFPWGRLGFGRETHFYEPGSWGRVFPMGMYTACTVNLAGVHTFTPLAVVPRFWGWFTLVVWGLTFLGTLRAAGRMLGRAFGFTAQSPRTETETRGN